MDKIERALLETGQQIERAPAPWSGLSCSGVHAIRGSDSTILHGKHDLSDFCLSPAAPLGADVQRGSCHAAWSYCWTEELPGPQTLRSDVPDRKDPSREMNPKGGSRCSPRTSIWADFSILDIFVREDRPSINIPIQGQCKLARTTEKAGSPGRDNDLEPTRRWSSIHQARKVNFALRIFLLMCSTASLRAFFLEEPEKRPTRSRRFLDVSHRL